MGKLEVTFKKSDNPKFDRICLVFIKIPIEDKLVNILTKLVVSEEPPSLAKGRFDVNTSGTHKELIGIIRIKQIKNLHIIVHSLIMRMKKLLKHADTISNRDDIGNRVFPVFN